MGLSRLVVLALVGVVTMAGASMSCSGKSSSVDAAVDAAHDVAPDTAMPDTPADVPADAPADVPAETRPDTPPETPDLVSDRAVVDAGRCTRPISEVVNTCPTTYDLVPGRACTFVAIDGGTSASACGNFLIFAARGILSDTLVCYYDATSRSLVAVSQCTDYGAYCGGTDYCYWAGVPVGACEVSDSSLNLLHSSICPDGGSGDGLSPG